ANGVAKALVHPELLRLLDRRALDRGVEREHVIGANARLDGIELAERPNEQTGGSEKDHAHRELRDDERLLQTVSALPGRNLTPRRRHCERALGANARRE